MFVVFVVFSDLFLFVAIRIISMTVINTYCKASLFKCPHRPLHNLSEIKTINNSYLQNLTITKLFYIDIMLKSLIVKVNSRVFGTI